MTAEQTEKKPIAERIAQISENLEFSNLPTSVVEASKRYILDVLGCIIGAKVTTSSKVMMKVMVNLGGVPQSSIIGHDKKTSAPLAAMINGTAGHAFDMDDDHREGTLHCSVVVLPAVLSVAENVHASGKDVILAYALGAEHMIRLGESFLGTSYYQGFHPTGTTGVFGAALGVAKILELDLEKTVWSLGIAGSQAAGLLEWKADGTWTKRMQAGHPAMTGVMSALLAQEGYTGPATIFEGEDGFVRAFSYRDQYDVSKIIDGFGQRWELLTNSIKPHACCRFACPVADVALDVAKNNQFNPDDIKEAVVRCNDWMIRVLCKPEERKVHPITVVDAQFSLPYVAAVSLVHKRASVPEFTDNAIKDPVVLEVAKKIRWQFDQEFEDRYPKAYPSAIKVTTNDRLEFEAQVDFPKGDPENPVTDEELMAKFELLASVVLPKSTIDKIVDKVMNLEKVADINELMRILK